MMATDKVRVAKNDHAFKLIRTAARKRRSRLRKYLVDALCNIYDDIYCIIIDYVFTDRKIIEFLYKLSKRSRTPEVNALMIDPFEIGDEINDIIRILNVRSNSIYFSNKLWNDMESFKNGSLKELFYEPRDKLISQINELMIRESDDKK